MRQQIASVCWLILFTLLTAGQALVWAGETQSPQMSAVVAEIGRIGKAAKGIVGVAAIHLETGRGFEKTIRLAGPVAAREQVTDVLKRTRLQTEFLPGFHLLDIRIFVGSLVNLEQVALLHVQDNDSNFLAE